MRVQAQEEIAAGSSGYFLQPQHIEMDMTAGDATAHVMLGQMMLPMPDVATAPADIDAVQDGANYSELGGNGAAADGSGSMDHHMGYGSDGSDNDEDDSGSCHSGDSEVSHSLLHPVHRSQRPACAELAVCTGLRFHRIEIEHLFRA